MSERSEQASDARHPLVSALVPSFNHARFITRTIESVYEQTYAPIELLVIDDGSKDDSPAILRKLRDRYGFELIEQENQGVVATVERLVAWSRGKYLAFLASDDYWAPERIARGVEVMEADPRLSFCHANGRSVDAEGRDLGACLRGDEFPREWGMVELFQYSTFIVPCSTLIRREALVSAAVIAEKLETEDFQLWLRLLKRGPARFIPEELAFRRIHGSNTTRVDPERLDRSRWALYESMDAELKQLAKPYFALNAFVGLARQHKRRALPYLLPALPLARNRRFWYGMYRLLATR